MATVSVVNIVLVGILAVLFGMFVATVVRMNARTRKLLEVCQEILERTSKGNTEN